MSIEKASQEQAAKKAKVDKYVEIASRLGWRDVEKGRECFVMKEKDGLKQWGSIFMPRNKRDVTDIWKKFVPKETLDRLIKEFNESKNVIGSRKSKNGAAIYDKHLILDERKALQAFTVYIYICAKQAKPSEVRKNGRFRRIQSMQALEFFRSKRTDADKEKISGIQTIEVLLSRMLFTMDYTEDLSKNFRSVVDSVGQHAAGDEKLFDKCGEWKSLKNIETGEVFTYHWDTQKGVGKKYCISWGLERTDSKHFVKFHEHRIPAYGYYKNMFEVCDNFNRGLHDRQWPLKRGGSGISGELGCHHDFVMAVVMQNVRNAWLSVNQAKPSEHSFEDLMIELATGLLNESIDL